MSRNKIALMLTTAVAAASALGGAASAAVTNVNGGGASLPAPYVRGSADCYGVKTDLINAAAAGATTPTLQTLSDFNYTGAVPFNCAVSTVNSNARIIYSSTGSGRGIQAFGSHDPLFFGDIDPNTAGIQLQGTVNYALSETSVSAAQVGFYNNGGLFTTSVTVVAPGATPGVGQYANPKEKYGNMIQYPFLIAPVTIAYDPVYKKVRQADGSVKEYSFAVRASYVRSSGGLRLDQDTYCKIFNGQITNWNDPALTALNGKSLKDPTDPTPTASWSVPMQIAGRSDSSGTTSLWTRHLAAACAGVAGNAYADSTPLLPATLQGVVYDKNTANNLTPGTPGLYVRAAGNDGVAKYIDFTVAPGNTAGDTVVQGRIGYVGPDFTLPAAAITLANNYNLNTATLKNASGNWIAPSPASASSAFGTRLPPDSTSRGLYDPTSLDSRSRSNPADWVEAASKTSVLANPTATNGYPIVGTSNILLYTCYASAKQFGALTGYLKWYNDNAIVTDSNLGILAQSGFAPMPSAWRKAISETFLGNGSGLNLNIAKVGTGASGCSTAGVVGG
jgi:ABC-type phosphate transport system substrate-binding protein